MPSELIATTSDQRKSSVARDQIGRDKITNSVAAPLVPPTVIEALLEKLNLEMEHNQHARNTIEKLLRYHGQATSDGIVGLEAKLKAGNREYETYAALEQKELFAKLLERFSLYASAQEILAHLLARAEYHFTHFVYPQLSDLSIVQVNELVDERIVTPTVQDCGASVFAIDHSVAMGMIYWLAERCFVRWHQ